jgi:hypothetical protein
MGTAPPLAVPPKSATRHQQENQERQYRANGGDVSIQGVHVSPSKALASRLAVAHGLDSDSALTPDHLPRAAREPVNNASTVNLEVMLSYSSDEFGSVSWPGDLLRSLLIFVCLFSFFSFLPPCMLYALHCVTRPLTHHPHPTPTLKVLRGGGR